MIKYRQNPLNSCCFSSLASAISGINQTKTSNDIAIHLEELLRIEVINHINFANAIKKRKTMNTE